MCIIAQSSDLDKRSQCEKHGKLLPQDTALRRGRASRRPRRRQIFPLATPLRQYALRGASILRHPAPISRSRQSCLFAPQPIADALRGVYHVEPPCAVTVFAAFPCWASIQTSRPSRCFYVKAPLRGSAFHGISPSAFPVCAQRTVADLFSHPSQKSRPLFLRKAAVRGHCDVFVLSARRRAYIRRVASPPRRWRSRRLTPRTSRTCSQSVPFKAASRSVSLCTVDLLMPKCSAHARTVHFVRTMYSPHAMARCAMLSHIDIPR